MVYRQTPQGAYDCGYMLKDRPGYVEGYIDRVLPDYVGILVLQGQGTFTDWRDREHRVEPGCFIQHPPQRKHSVVPDDENWAEFFITFPAAMYETLCRLRLMNDQPVLRPGVDASLIEQCDRVLAEAHQAEANVSMYLASMHALVALVGQMHQAGGETPGWRQTLDLACQRLSKQFDQPLSLQQLAEDLGMDYEPFRKRFRQHIGQSPGEYRIRRRLDHARHLLLHDRLSVKETAYRLGYPDPFTFSRQFTRYMGQTPSQCRKGL